MTSESEGWQVGGSTYDLLRERDELRAEIERLQELYGAAMDGLNKLDAENERLRAENTTLTDHNDSLQAAVRKLNRLLEDALARDMEC